MESSWFIRFDKSITLKANKMIQGQQFQIRLNEVKQRRDYGGIKFYPVPHIGYVTFVSNQGGIRPYIVTLNEPFAGYPKGHKIAISDRDIL